MLLRCKCGNEWNYKGSAKHYATCTQCYGKVKISPQEQESIVELGWVGELLDELFEGHPEEVRLWIGMQFGVDAVAEEQIKVLMEVGELTREEAEGVIELIMRGQKDNLTPHQMAALQRIG